MNPHREDDPFEARAVDSRDPVGGDPGREDDESPSRVPFAHMSQSRVRRVLNCLAEATFFYRGDDPDVFDYLRKHRSEFERFFAHFFEWDLHVDRKSARLFKRRQYNPALTPKQRSLFNLTRREECILFMLLLEFHEQELARQNVHYEHDEDLHFLLSDFVEHAIARYTKELGDTAPPDREIFSSIQALFRQLERHRFIELVERTDTSSGESLRAGQAEHVLYSFLPGIHCYDPGRLSIAVFEQLVKSRETSSRTSTDSNEDAESDNGDVPGENGEEDDLNGEDGADELDLEDLLESLRRAEEGDEA